MVVSELNKGDQFTTTDQYDPTCTLVYTYERTTDGLCVCRDQHGWNRCFAPEEIVYPISFSSLDGEAYRK